VSAASAATGLSADLLAWDTSPLFHAIRAGKLDVLGDTARTWQGGGRRNVTTQTVVDELSTYGLSLANADWLEIVHVDHLNELTALVKWMDQVSGSKSNEGEATVLAWAEVNGAIAVIDDGDARRIARKHSLPVWGSLRVIATAVIDGHTTEYVASNLVDALIDSGARYPCTRGQFISWAKQNCLL
jgi:predicted nucleic acid-binding protein